eukprot:scaffold2534_cov364-Prasinococcus_capsulatus_cf.AAC.13
MPAACPTSAPCCMSWLHSATVTNSPLCWRVALAQWYRASIYRQETALHEGYDCPAGPRLAQGAVDRAQQHSPLLWVGVAPARWSAALRAEARPPDWSLWQQAGCQEHPAVDAAVARRTRLSARRRIAAVTLCQRDRGGGL